MELFLICILLFYYLEPIGLDELPRTRSGRTIKPPTQYWAGQRYVVSESTGEIRVERPDLSITPAADVSLNATPIVRFKTSKVKLCIRKTLFNNVEAINEFKRQMVVER